MTIETARKIAASIRPNSTWAHRVLAGQRDDDDAVRAVMVALSKIGAATMMPDMEYEKTYFERGMFAAYAWMVTKKRGEQLSDAVVDHAWDNRDAGMGPTECLPKRHTPTS